MLGAGSIAGSNRNCGARPSSAMARAWPGGEIDPERSAAPSRAGSRRRGRARAARSVADEMRAPVCSVSPVSAPRRVQPRHDVEIGDGLVDRRVVDRLAARHAEAERDREAGHGHVRGSGAWSCTPTAGTGAVSRPMPIAVVWRYSICATSPKPIAATPAEVRSPGSCNRLPSPDRLSWNAPTTSATGIANSRGERNGPAKISATVASRRRSRRGVVGVRGRRGDQASQERCGERTLVGIASQMPG
jgi:hypothetical protein